ncbi:MAG: hypothetical protein WCO92_00525 [Verrucomicrobiota bacterium]
MRTTVDIELPILKELKSFSKQHNFSLGKAVTSLLAEALSADKAKTKKKSPPKFKWYSRDMGPAKIDLLDKDALYRILDEEFYQKK